MIVKPNCTAPQALPRGENYRKGLVNRLNHVKTAINGVSELGLPAWRKYFLECKPYQHNCPKVIPVQRQRSGMLSSDYSVMPCPCVTPPYTFHQIELSSLLSLSPHFLARCIQGYTSTPPEFQAFWQSGARKERALFLAFQQLQHMANRKPRKWSVFNQDWVEALAPCVRKAYERHLFLLYLHSQLLPDNTLFVVWTELNRSLEQHQSADSGIRLLQNTLSQNSQIKTVMLYMDGIEGENLKPQHVQQLQLLLSTLYSHNCGLYLVGQRPLLKLKATKNRMQDYAQPLTERIGKVLRPVSYQQALPAADFERLLACLAMGASAYET